MDGILAAKLVTEQGIEAVTLHFRMPFAPPARRASEERLRKLAEIVGANLVSVEVGEDYLELIKNPEYGYARGLAPCVDCIVYMLKKAKELAKEINADFVFTGEVVGQRSHSQNKRSLKAIEKASGLSGRLLRPLSAKLLDPTIPELTGLIRRERLLDIKGHGRRRQIRLAHEFGIINYAPPAGGCLLMDVNLAARVKDAMAHDQLGSQEFELLRCGRHFRLDSGAKVVVGRNERENGRLEELATDGDLVCRPVDVMGPVAVLRAKRKTKKDTEIAARICARYSDGEKKRAVKVDCGGKELKARPSAAKDIERWRVVPDREEEPNSEDD